MSRPPVSNVAISHQISASFFVQIRTTYIIEMLYTYRAVVATAVLGIIGRAGAAAVPPLSAPAIFIPSEGLHGFNITTSANSTEVQDNTFAYRWCKSLFNSYEYEMNNNPRKITVDHATGRIRTRAKCKSTSLVVFSYPNQPYSYWGGWSHCIDKPDNSQWTSLEFDRPTCEPLLNLKIGTLLIVIQLFVLGVEKVAMGVDLDTRNQTRK